MRVTLVMTTLGGGGAKRVAANIANCCGAKGWIAAIITTCVFTILSVVGEHPRRALRIRVVCEPNTDRVCGFVTGIAHIYARGHFRRVQP